MSNKYMKYKRNLCKKLSVWLFVSLLTILVVSVVLQSWEIKEGYNEEKNFYNKSPSSYWINFITPYHIGNSNKNMTLFHLWLSVNPKLFRGDIHLQKLMFLFFYFMQLSLAYTSYRILYWLSKLSCSISFIFFTL